MNRRVPLLAHILAMLAERDLRYEQRFTAQQDALRAAFQAAKEAATKLETDTDNRLGLLNELRSGVATAEQLQALAARLADVKERLDKLEARSGGLSAAWGYLLGAVGLAAAVVTIIIATR